MVEIDRGFEEAWEALQADRGLADLVTAYRESLSLAQDRHPSYSLLAAVGIIEAFGEGAEASKCEKVRERARSGCALSAGAQSSGR
nr:hypothetical protein GCM10020092_005250 [Actinoplanes digitatis]